MALEKVGREDEALVNYAAVGQYFPGPEPRVRQAQLLQKLGRDGDARELARGRRAHAEPRARACAPQSNAMARQGQADRASLTPCPEFSDFAVIASVGLVLSKGSALSSRP